MEIYRYARHDGQIFGHFSLEGKGLPFNNSIIFYQIVPIPKTVTLLDNFLRFGLVGAVPAKIA